MKTEIVVKFQNPDIEPLIFEDVSHYNEDVASGILRITFVFEDKVVRVTNFPLNNILFYSVRTAYDKEETKNG